MTLQCSLLKCLGWLAGKQPDVTVKLNTCWFGSVAWIKGSLLGTAAGAAVIASVVHVIAACSWGLLLIIAGIVKGVTIIVAGVLM